jgi:enoyl-CoA hydratase
MTRPAILYETPTPGIARIVLNRAETRNAQDTAFLYALNEAFDRAVHDDQVKVIVLSANGPHFSSGHDLREVDGHGNMKKHETVGTWGGFGKRVRRRSTRASRRSMSASVSAGATSPSRRWRWYRAR